MQSGNGRGVQQAEVSAAADALLAQGQRPTVDRVRRQLGRGSPNTVGPMLETWFVGLAPRLGYPSSENGAVNAPPAEIRQAMDALWHLACDQARQEAQKTLGEERDHLRAQRDQLNEDRRLLARDAAALTERDNMRNAALERALGQADNLALQLQAMQAVVQRRDEELGSVRISLARTIEAKDAAEHEHRLAIQAIEVVRGRSEERFLSAERRYLEEIDRVRQDAKSIKKRFEDHKAQTEKQQQSWIAEKEAIQGNSQALVAELAGLRARLAAAEQRVHDLRDKASNSRTQTGAKRSRKTSLSR